MGVVVLVMDVMVVGWVCGGDVEVGWYGGCGEVVLGAKVWKVA